MARASLETRLAVINLTKSGKSKTFIMKKLNVGRQSKLVFVPPSSDGTSPKSPETFKTSHYVAAMQKLAKDMCTWFGGSMQFKVIRDRASQHIKADKEGSLTPLNLPILEACPPLKRT